jgi:pilus assembly protein Flp/PilA
MSEKRPTYAKRQNAMTQSSTFALLHSFWRDQRGATAIEYALIASGISIVIVGTVASLGSSVKNFYTSLASAMK